MAAVLSDAEVFGTAPSDGTIPGRPPVLNDAAVFGTPPPTTGGLGDPGTLSGAVAEGFRTAPRIVDQPAIDQADQSGWLGHYITSPLLQGINLPLQLGNAAFKGGQATVESLLAPLNPVLGTNFARDIAAFPEAFMGTRVREAPELPMRADFAYRNRMMPDEPLRPPFEMPPPGPAPLDVPSFVSERAAPPRATGMSDADRIQQLVEHYVNEDQPVMGPPMARGPLTAETPPPQPSAGETAPPQRGAVGADVTRGPLPAQTATQTQDAFENSVLQTAEDRAHGIPGEDQTTYVPGTARTEAARVFSPDASVTERTLRDTDQAFNAKVTQVENDAKDTLLDDYRRQAGNNDAIDQAKQTRDAFSPDQLGVFENQQPTTRGQGIVDYFNRLLASPEGKRGNVRGILEDARDGFLDKDGNPETMPSVLYGGRKNLTDILNEGLSSSTSTRKASVQAARKFLTDALDEHVDPAINDGAPLFDTFRTQWHELSKPIDRMEFLQQHLFGPGDVRGTDGKIQFGAVQNLLEKMVGMRKATGNNPAKSFDLEHLDQLLAIRNELGAWHLRDRLYNMAGSPTVSRASKAAQLQSGPLGQAIQGAADLAGHAAAFKVLGPLGNVGYQTIVRPAVQSAIRAPAARALARTKVQMLNTTPRNELGPPIN